MFSSFSLLFCCSLNFHGNKSFKILTSCHGASGVYTLQAEFDILFISVFPYIIIKETRSSCLVLTVVTDCSKSSSSDGRNQLSGCAMMMKTVIEATNLQLSFKIKHEEKVFSHLVC